MTVIAGCAIYLVGLVAVLWGGYVVGDGVNDDDLAQGTFGGLCIVAGAAMILAGGWAAGS